MEDPFEDTLPHAAPPKERHPALLPALAQAFVQTNPGDLRHTLATHDRTQPAAAFARAATARNACHLASGHGFIEDPLVPGHSIPNLDPLTP
ncbi:MAG: hypothetical protein IPL40_14805 [Proteobacteria bacterium]|nr:hypothetical protein [Pseudomonadota bacterium]